MHLDHRSRDQVGLLLLLPVEGALHLRLPRNNRLFLARTCKARSLLALLVSSQVSQDHGRGGDRDCQALLQAALPQRARLRQRQRRCCRAAGKKLRLKVEIGGLGQVRPHRRRPAGALRPLHPPEEGEREGLRDGGRHRGERLGQGLQGAAAVEHPGLHWGHLGRLQDGEEALPEVHHRTHKSGLPLVPQFNAITARKYKISGQKFLKSANK